MGKRAFFIRLFGCPIHCPWCDSAGTWHPEWVPPQIERISEEQLVQEALQTGAEMVVITGGEPTIHDLGPLTELLSKEGIAVHLETSGAFLPRGRFDWITVSPKKWAPLLEENVRNASEFKIIVEVPEDIVFYSDWIQEKGFMPTRTGPSVWLHPEWSQRRNPRVLDAIIQWVKDKGLPYRAGWQIHKLYAADTLDPRSRAAVPLGGDLSRGY